MKVCSFVNRLSLARVLPVFVVLVPVSLFAINLNGTTVAKEKFVVYLLIGHSNMAGINTSNCDNQTHPRAWTYRWFDTNKRWVLAKEDRGSASNGLSGGGSGGPGMPFLKQMVNRYPDKYFGVISAASYSSTCRGVNTGNNGSDLSAEANRYWKGAYLYEQLVAAALAVKNDVTFGGVLCMLGSIEATRASDESVCRDFSDNIKQMVHDLRDDLNEPYLPFIMADYEKGATGNFSISKPWPKIIAEQTDSVSKKLIISAVINSKSIQMLDDHHFTIAGQGEWAKRVADTIAVKKWMPLPLTGNLPPRVRAGRDFAVNLGVSLNLEGVITDDASATPTCQWSVVRKPSAGTVVFSNIRDRASAVTFEKQAGRYTLRLTANDGTNSAYDDVVYEAFPERPDTVFFQENTGNGLVSIEAENYHFATARGSISWQKTTQSGNSGAGCVRAMPNSGKQIEADYLTLSPELDYYIYFAKTGTHYLWTRGLGAATADDSYHAGIDFAAVPACDKISGFKTSWTWGSTSLDNNERVSFQVETPGLHVLNAYMREDGLVIDKFVITSNANYTPGAEGPAQSPRQPLVSGPDTSDTSANPGLLDEPGRIVLLAPAGGESYKVGDILTIKWASGIDVSPVDILLSLNGGLSFFALNATSIHREFDPGRWGTFNWKIPEFVVSQPDTFHFNTKTNCLVKIMEYSTTDPNRIDMTDKPFTIGNGTGTRVFRREDAAEPGQGPFFVDVSIAGSQAGIVAMYSLQGRLICTAGRGGPGQSLPVMLNGRLPGGVYLVSRNAECRTMTSTRRIARE